MLLLLEFESFDDLLAMLASKGTRQSIMQAVLAAMETGKEASCDCLIGTLQLALRFTHIANMGERNAFVLRAAIVGDTTRVTESVLLAGILESSENKIFWKDADRRFLGANQAFLDYYGFESIDFVLGKTDEEMDWHAESDEFRATEENVLFGKPAVRMQGTCLARGELRRIIASKRPLVSHGRVVGLVGSFEDIGPAK